MLSITNEVGDYKQASSAIQLICAASECGRSRGSGWFVGLRSDESLRGRAILARRERVGCGANAAMDGSQNPRRIGLLRSKRPIPCQESGRSGCGGKSQPVKVRTYSSGRSSADFQEDCHSRKSTSESVCPRRLRTMLTIRFSISCMTASETRTRTIVPRFHNPMVLLAPGASDS
jgi:hypothetical protein